MFDNTCKFLSETFPCDFTTWLLGEPIILTELSPAELSLEPIRADALILLQSEEIVLHLEFQTLPKPNIPLRMADNLPSDFAVSTVTFHEQVLGCHAYINRARNLDGVVKGYEIMTRLISDFKVLPLISFDAGAATTFDQLQSQRIQLAKMDARIAAIALFRGLILLTRNHRDFGKVVGLLIEDWTV